jgi:hypothetical protein
MKCCHGIYMCVSMKHGLVIVPDMNTMKLEMYSLVDGSLVRSVGGRGIEKGKFNCTGGGLCVSPDEDSVLVAEYYSNRVQEVSIVDGSWVRFVGEGVLNKPQFVDCNAEVIVVSDARCRICVFSWADGNKLSHFGDEIPKKLDFAGGVRLLADGSGIVVSHQSDHCLCVFTLTGDFVRTIGSRNQGLYHPLYMIECSSDNSFFVVNDASDCVTKLSRDGPEFQMFDHMDYDFYISPAALQLLPDSRMIVIDACDNVMHVFRGFELRKTWVTVCVLVTQMCGSE